MKFTPDHCANCDTPLPRVPPTRASLFCGRACRQLARAVRAYRTLRREGREDEQGARFGAERKLNRAVAGGYLNEVPSARVRRLVVARASERCQRCGAPGQDVDHIDGPSANPENLQLLCRGCHTKKTTGVPRPLAPGEPELREQVFSSRIAPCEPTRLCDAETVWDTVEAELRVARRHRLARWEKRAGQERREGPAVPREAALEPEPAARRTSKRTRGS